MKDVNEVLRWIFPGLLADPSMELPRRHHSNDQDLREESVNLMYPCPSRLSWTENFERAKLFSDDDVRANPHTWQRLCDPLSSKLSAVSIPFNRSLENDAPRRVYRRRHTDAIKSVIHWGQRKLLLSEIEFISSSLASYSFKQHDLTVLYVGAGPGHHIPILIEMFPQIRKWVLFDKTDFSFDKTDSERVEICKRYFTDADTIPFSDKNLLFICDIRNLSANTSSPTETEKSVSEDMQNQMNWVLKMNPDFSMLKFRLPYVPGSTPYLSGRLKLPVWGPQTTTEVRLIVEKNAGFQIYDNQKHWEQMFFFNTVTRVCLYDFTDRADKMDRGICACFDCSSEFSILANYFPGEEFFWSDRISVMLGGFGRRKSLIDC